MAHDNRDINELSAAQCVDELLERAIKEGASDIHLEPRAHDLRIRFRIDGSLVDQKSLDAVCAAHVVARLKVLARINIAEKRIPQDGKLFFTVGDNTVDLRVSTFPTLEGEKVVVRILDRANHMLTLEQLGMSDTLLAHLRTLIERASGFFLVTGPTGSGKTTTLYAIISELNGEHTNIVTLEDPVEYRLNGITQGQINPDAGFTFDRGIRSLLRQDPNILMVGEIRDKETARVAIEAALTGHVVLSTLHTNDAVSVFVRLLDMGIEPFLVNASLCGVLAQRLVRTLCQTCKKPAEISSAMQGRLRSYGIEQKLKSFTSAGCDACAGRGYKGRTALFELLVPDTDLRELVMSDPHHDALNAWVKQSGMKMLRADGLEKVQQGLISLEDLLRVLF